MSIFRQVDGKSSHTPVSPSPGVRIYERHHRIYLKTDFGLTVRFDGDDEAGDFLCACVSVNGLADNAVHRNNVPAGGGVHFARDHPTTPVQKEDWRPVRQLRWTKSKWLDEARWQLSPQRGGVCGELESVNFAFEWGGGILGMTNTLLLLKAEFSNRHLFSTWAICILYFSNLVQHFLCSVLNLQHLSNKRAEIASFASLSRHFSLISRRLARRSVKLKTLELFPWRWDDACQERANVLLWTRQRFGQQREISFPRGREDFLSVVAVALVCHQVAALQHLYQSPLMSKVQFIKHLPADVTSLKAKRRQTFGCKEIKMLHAGEKYCMTVHARKLISALSYCWK